ncbi:MAG: hypothetical protein KME13_19825 [Myxacorys californica WJT36-NPBG1]|nr:hypothetical protein [Myxacorys californica WJT36-NPBG1]
MQRRSSSIAAKLSLRSRSRPRFSPAFQDWHRSSLAALSLSPSLGHFPLRSRRFVPLGNKTMAYLKRDGWVSNPKAFKRYHPQKRRRTAKRAKALTRGKCVCCSAPATEAHHAFYGIPVVYPVALLSIMATVITSLSLFGFVLIPLLWGYSLPLPGFEFPLWQVFPLCNLHHSNHPGCAHNFGNYGAFKADLWANRNKYGYLWKLRISDLSRLVF